MKFIRQSIYILLIFQYSFSFSQGLISGIIQDKSIGSILVGASIKIDEINHGVETNSTGQYQINNINEDEYTIIASYVGYQSNIITFKINSEKAFH